MGKARQDAWSNSTPEYRHFHFIETGWCPTTSSAGFASSVPRKRVPVKKTARLAPVRVRCVGEIEEVMRPKKLMEFPHLLDPHRDVMLKLVSTFDHGVGSHLISSSLTVPSDLEFYQNDMGSSQGSLCINRGVDSSPIDFILTAWMHLATPTGNSLDITNIQGYMKPTADAPHFQFELVQCSPTYFLFFLDLIPRKDLVFYPDYLKTYYEDLNLDSFRQKLAEDVPEAKPFFSSSLYFRHVISPTGVMVGVDFEDGDESRIGEVIGDCIGNVSENLMKIWIEKCVNEGRMVGDEERIELARRDRMIKSRAIEMDLSSNMPKQFGQELSDRFLGVIRSVFGT